jgi:hypothetical protein
LNHVEAGVLGKNGNGDDPEHPGVYGDGLYGSQFREHLPDLLTVLAQKVDGFFEEQLITLFARVAKRRKE